MPTVFQLEASRPHIHYTIRQMLDMARQLESAYPMRATLARGIWSAMVESFVTQARALVEFLYEKEKVPGDARAYHFFKNENDWRATHSVIPTVLAGGKKQANKQVDHLTYDRNDFAEHEWGWDFGAICQELIRTLREIDADPSKLLVSLNVDDAMISADVKPTDPISFSLVAPSTSNSSSLPSLFSMHAKTGR